MDGAERWGKVRDAGCGMRDGFGWHELPEAVRAYRKPHYRASNARQSLVQITMRPQRDSKSDVNELGPS
jgi:hypothetical protein